MSIIITNIDGYTNTYDDEGECEYRVTINHHKHICNFKHIRSEGLAVCLEKAAKAVKKFEKYEKFNNRIKFYRQEASLGNYHDHYDVDKELRYLLDDMGLSEDSTEYLDKEDVIYNIVKEFVKY